MASKKNGLANWPARGHLSHPFSQGVVRQDQQKLGKPRLQYCLNPFSQGVVRQDRRVLQIPDRHYRLNPFSQGVVRQDKMSIREFLNSRS